VPGKCSLDQKRWTTVIEEGSKDLENIRDTVADPEKCEGEKAADIADPMLKWCDELPLPIDFPICEGARRAPAREVIQDFQSHRDKEVEKIFCIERGRSDCQ
jgi:hypothetical protein